MVEENNGGKNKSNEMMIIFDAKEGSAPADISLKKENDNKDEVLGQGKLDSKVSVGSETGGVSDHERVFSSKEEFNYKLMKLLSSNMSLSEVMRPHNLSSYIGQEELIGTNGILTGFISLSYLPQMILYGSPGTGKTTLASILAHEAGYVFVEISATDTSISKLKDLSESVLFENKRRDSRGLERLNVLVFIDEIHRLNKVQQDVLLPILEEGRFAFIGATTFNPKSRVRKSICSRCQLFELRPLSYTQIRQVVKRAILYQNIRRKIKYKLQFLSYSEDSIHYIINHCNRDTRKAVGYIEMLSFEFKFKVGPDHTSDDLYLLSFDEVEHAFKNINAFSSEIKDKRNLPLLQTLLRSILFSGRDRNKRTKHEPRAFEGTYELSKDREVVKNQELKSSPIMQNEEHISDTQEAHKIEQSTEETSKKYNLIKLLHFYNRTEESVDTDSETSCSDDDATILQTSEGKLEDSFQSLLDSLRLFKELLNRGESPLYIARQLLIFSCIYVSNPDEFMNCMAQVKSIFLTNTNPHSHVETMISNLCYSKKIPFSSLLRDNLKSRICLMKNYFSPQVMHEEKVSSADKFFKFLTVEYNDEEVKSLSKEPQYETTMNKSMEFRIEYIDEEQYAT